MYLSNSNIQTDNLFRPDYVDGYTGYIEPVPEKNLISAQVETPKQSWKLTDKRKAEFKEAKGFLYDLVYDRNLSPLAVAQSYIEEWPEIEAEPLRSSPNDERRTAWQKFNKGTRPAFRLFGSLDRPHLYTLHAEHLGLLEYYSHAEKFSLYSYDPELRGAWKKAIDKHFAKQTCFYKFENASRFHVHLLASHDAGLNQLTRQGEVIKRVEPGTEERVLAYLYKPHATYTEINLAMWIHAKRDAIYSLDSATGTTRNLPKTCGYKGLTPVKQWNA